MKAPSILALAASLVLIQVCVAQPDDGLFRLSDLARELSDDPAARAEVLRRLGQNPAAAGLLSPKQKQQLKEAIRRGDWAFVDRFPGTTVAEMGATVRLAGATRRAKPTRPAGQPQDSGGLGGSPTRGRRVIELLGIPTGGEPLTARWKDLGGGLKQGSRVHPDRAKRYPDSARMAEVLNRLARNDASDPRLERFQLMVDGNTVATPEFLLILLRSSGHTITVRDARYIANFGDLSYRGKDVATPYWTDTEVAVPGTDRNLVVPVSHSQHELIVRGPLINTDVSFFFGIDGEAKFRPMGGQGQDWVGGTIKRTYKGEQAIEAARLAGAIHRSYTKKTQRYTDLPFGGYFPLGVCNDSNAMIEMHMTGKTTLYPLTREVRYFPSDDEVDVLARRLPVDGKGDAPDLARILGSLPVSTLDELPFPELRNDLRRLLAAKGRTGLTELDRTIDQSR